MAAAHRREEQICPELTGHNGRTRLVVLACEVGGRWSEEAQDFVHSLARAKAVVEVGDRVGVQVLQGPSRAVSLLERRGGLGADGAIPSCF